VQKSAFQQEFQLLIFKALTSFHSLLRLTPFVDSDGILRIGGRLQALLLTEEAKHPIILSKDFAFIMLVISNAHLKTFHGGTQATLVYTGCPKTMGQKFVEWLMTPK